MISSRDDDEDDEDAWDEDDLDAVADDDEPTVPCPSCRREILEDVPQCPYCGRFISAEEHAAPGRPLWVLVTAVICLGMAIWWAVGYGG